MKKLNKITFAILLALGVNFSSIAVNAAALDLNIGNVSFDGWSSMQECLDANYGGVTANCVSVYDDCGVREVDIYAARSTMNSLLEHLRDGGDIIVSLIDPNNNMRITEELCVL